MATKKKKAPAKKKPAKKKAPASKKKAPAKKKPAAKKPAAKKAPAKRKKAAAEAPHALPWRVPLPGESFIGVVEDYYAHIGVVAVTLKAPLSVGQRIHVRGHTTDLTQSVDSMQIGHQGVQSAGSGDGVGLKVGDKCRAGDYVYRCGS